MRFATGGSSAVVVLGVSVGTHAPVPSLDALGADPTLAATLPVEQAWALYQRALAALLALLPVLRPPGSPGSPGAEEERLLTPAQVASLLGVARGRIYELVRTAGLPAVRIGKYVRVSRRALQAWLAERAKKPLLSATDNLYTTGYDRSGAPAPPQAARVDPGPVRPRLGNLAEPRGQARARRAPGSGARRPARPAPGGRRPAPAPPDDDDDRAKW